MLNSDADSIKLMNLHIRLYRLKWLYQKSIAYIIQVGA
jgi:hypothetical protein